MSQKSLDNILKKVESIADEFIRPNANRIDEKAEWPEENIKAIQLSGIAGLVIPKKYGGHELGLTGLLRTCEIMGKECASTAMCFGMHSVGSAVLAAKSTKSQVEQFIIPIVQGKHITTLALSEPGTGAHFYFPQTQMSKTGDNYIINGGKSFVTNGSYADSYVISTDASTGKSQPGIFSCVILPNNLVGMKWGEQWNGLGMRGNSSISLDIENVSVPKNYLLGKEGDELWYIFKIIAPYFLTAMAGTYLGIAWSAMSELESHLKKRRYGHNGKTLRNEVILQHRFGKLWAELEKIRSFSYRASELFDNQKPQALPYILSIKADIADSAVNIVNECMTLMGGIVYRENSSMSRHLRDVRASHVMSPTTDLLRIWTARSVLDLPILSEL